jgi:Uma2 family endonuclease
VREESPNVSMAAVAHHNLELPDSAYNLWLRDELTGKLRLPNDGTKVEIIGGEIVVSPGPDFAHNDIIQDIEGAFVAARIAEPSFPWRCVHTMDLNLSGIQDGYIPDLIVLDIETRQAARKAQASHLLPEQAGLVVEVTSRSTAADDRQPSLRRLTPTKWTGYAQVGIPYYLLVDRAPRSAHAILYSDPDQGSGSYGHLRVWEFGEAIRLPEPFGVVVETDEWEPWA